ncbi:hypothetical protein RCZ01_12830 [Capnocytophaga felis]|uniref:BIG2 domain-containing protein n=2 Tax=Capnocytophaga felis TaxID=2267611 RepID=A0A5M4B8Q0_9FLAO|nr:hypothetical protein RCZ01_12830 [Capnocytophaga felis]GET49167.1 hypothetical protein RCZ02_19980 [Capnocytophaga felis]
MPIVAEKTPVINLSETSPLKLAEGESKEVIISGEHIDKFEVKSSNVNVASINVDAKAKKFVIEAKTSGTATITVSSGGKTTELEVQVSKIPVERIEIEAQHNFQPGNQRLTANVYPENASNKTLVWESSDTQIVRIVNPQTGEIYINPRYGASATLTIKATDGSGVSTKHLINVVKLVQNITILAITQLGVGANHNLQATIEPHDATNTTLNWESSNPDVVSVDGQGKVTALKEGRATITAQATDGSFVSQSIEIKVVLGINKVTIDQAQDKTMQIKKGKHPLSVSIWHNNEKKEQGIMDKSKSGFGSVSWQIVSNNSDKAAVFGWKDGEKHILDAIKTGTVTIKAVYYDSLTGEHIDSDVITVNIEN